MVNFFAGSDPEWVLAELDAGFEDYGPAYAGDGGRDPALDPGATAYIHYREGVVALCSLSKRTATRFELDLLCERGRIRMVPGLTEIEIVAAGSAPVMRRLACPPYARCDTAAAIAELVGLADTLHPIENGGQGQCPPREARKALEIILSILRSQDRGNVRVDLPLDDGAPVRSVRGCGDTCSKEEADL